nr:unnamed protein product [Haemonchus contortus]
MSSWVPAIFVVDVDINLKDKEFAIGKKIINQTVDENFQRTSQRKIRFAQAKLSVDCPQSTQCLWGVVGDRSVCRPVDKQLDPEIPVRDRINRGGAGRWRIDDGA